jgi:serine/threonine protein kinase
MSQLSRQASRAVDHQLSRTAPDVNSPPRGVPSTGAAPSRRRLALVPGTSSHLTDELHCLLRRRLRVAGLIALTAFAVFLFKNLFFPNPALPPQPLLLALHAAVVAVMTVLCGLLWSRLPFGMRGLRTIELGLFGSMAFFFGYLQMTVFNSAQFVEWAVQERYEKLFATLATMGNSLRWFVLLVLYGTFIPNTWKRCATVVGFLVLLPLVLSFVSCSQCPILSPYQGSVLFDMTIVLLTGAAIAVFGSYRIQELQEEAFQARKLGQYRLVRRLGGGGMGEVYLGEHVLLRRDCAIKLIRPDQAGDPTNLSRFEREVRAMATLTHWNTVEIYDYGHAADGTFYYVMEYLPGLTLQELVDRHGPLPPGRAIHFLRQLCAALHEAHAIGLIHRDIKPTNVIACRRGGVYDVAKLLDFGLVVQKFTLGALGGSGSGVSGADRSGAGMSGAGMSGADKLTVQGTILGSPPFISPEQAMGKSQIDGRTDIYSLGGLGYFLLTGQPPFVRETPMELLVAHVRELATPLRELRPDVPHDLEEVLMKCLNKTAAERFPDAASLDKALAACAAAHAWGPDEAARWWTSLSADPQGNVAALKAEVA